MPRDRFHNPGFRIDPKRVGSTFPFQIAPGDPQCALQISPFLPIVTFS